MVALTAAPDVVLRKARENAARVAGCARAMAAAFGKGARVFATGNGGSSCDAQHATVAPSFSTPRLQEAHGALLHILWDLERGEEDVL